ncbi:T9SS type A sorting domain-containing protein [Hymenobacter monticola]|uniref:T9SS type A sorting domain-containing protein n=1 Tax=Hymenobacter monticola TaxID=1705399 RepID=A0ABY4B6R2_9BACT|nr:T9SS type A sorting domain-containing protein [Hymenobacter monticola]UOE34818.1 T9SS type A sorting domain-containing protein [Hymenobacter monticola]
MTPLLRPILGLLAAMLLPLGASAQGWAKSVYSPGNTHFNRVVVDASGATVAVGYYSSAATYNGQSLPLNGQLNSALVTKLDAQGAVQWTTALATSGTGTAARAEDVALDATGNTVVCGTYSGTLTLGTFALPANVIGSRANGFVAKLSPGGTVLWAQAITDSNMSTNADAVAVDATGMVYVAISNQPSALVAGMGLRLFSAAGVPGAQVDFPGVSGVAATSPLGVYGYISALTVNATTGQLAAIGEFQGTLTLRAGGTLPALAFTSPPEPQQGAFVMGLTTAGAPQWAQELTSTGYVNGGQRSYLNRLRGLCASGSGFAVAGGYQGAGTLAGQPLPGSATTRGAVAVLGQFDAQGRLQWAQAVAGNGAAGNEATAGAVACDAAGQLHLAGLFAGQLAASEGGLSSTGNADLFLLRYSSQGRLLGAQRDGSYGRVTPYALALDAGGEPRVAGDILGTVSLGGTVLASGSRTNGFVARLSRTPLAASRNAAMTTLSVFPNPGKATEGLTVCLEANATPITLCLMNVLGQRVRTQVVPAHITAATLPTAGLAPGRYVLQAAGATGLATRGVVLD